MGIERPPNVGKFILRFPFLSFSSSLCSLCLCVLCAILPGKSANACETA
jgi:hypothetical protein